MGDCQNGLFLEFDFIEPLLSVAVVAVAEERRVSQDHKKGEGHEEVH